MRSSYPINHWLYTLFTGPVIFCLGRLLQDAETYPFFVVMGIYFFAVLVAIFLSIPVMAFYGLIYYVLFRKNISPIKLKLIFVSITLASAIMVYLFTEGTPFLLFISYAISIVASGLILPIHESECEEYEP